MPKEKHTPIVSEKQKKFFGAEIGRAKAGKETRTGMSEETLAEHLEESGGKDLPEKVEKDKRDYRRPVFRSQMKRIGLGHLLRPPEISRRKLSVKKPLSNKIDTFINKMEDKDVEEMRSEIKRDTEERKKQLAENIGSKATGEQLAKQMKDYSRLAERSVRRGANPEEMAQLSVEAEDSSHGNLRRRDEARRKLEGLAVGKKIEKQLVKSINNAIENIEKAYPKVCPNCNAKIYGVIEPVKCPKCKKPWQAPEVKKQVRDPYAVATATAQRMGITDFSEGSEGRKKRDEIAEALRREKKVSKSIDEFIEKQARLGYCNKCKEFHRSTSPEFIKHRQYMSRIEPAHSTQSEYEESLDPRTRRGLNDLKAMRRNLKTGGEL